MSVENLIFSVFPPNDHCITHEDYNVFNYECGPFKIYVALYLTNDDRIHLAIEKNKSLVTMDVSSKDSFGFSLLLNQLKGLAKNL